MKKIILVLSCIALSLTVSAKAVKFSVDMTGWIISPNGIHITGDFQTIAGFSGGEIVSASAKAMFRALILGCVFKR